MIQLAHNLGLTVVAKGVQTEAVLRQLAALNCDSAQGYHIMKPAPARETLYWIEGRAAAVP